MKQCTMCQGTNYHNTINHRGFLTSVRLLNHIQSEAMHNVTTHKLSQCYQWQNRYLSNDLNCFSHVIYMSQSSTFKNIAKLLIHQNSDRPLWLNRQKENRQITQLDIKCPWYFEKVQQLSRKYSVDISIAINYLIIFFNNIISHI